MEPSFILATHTRSCGINLAISKKKIPLEIWQKNWALFPPQKNQSFCQVCSPFLFVTKRRNFAQKRNGDLHSPSSKILHPMQSLLLERMSSRPSPMSSPGLLSPSPKAAEQSPLSCPTSSSEESDKLKTNVAELLDQFLLPVLSSQLQNCGEQQESEAAAPRRPAPAAAMSEDR